SRALPQARTALDRLAASAHVRLALVSGRALADLARLAEVPDGTHLVGSHGAEPARLEDGHLVRDELALDPARSALHDELAAALTRLADGTAARVEVKPTTVVLHTRGLPAAEADRLTRAALGVGEAEGVDAMRGRDVVELSVLTVTKGDAVDALRASTGAGTVLYAGDDVTDERAMQRLRPGDVGIRVGDGETVAAFRVDGPDEMAATLHRTGPARGAARAGAVAG
ncbi:MAG TPA: trehalose-phosphatase, partial [Actinotalea sp.]|nr:trehalose-phosphatase [Actinotalea sp.]